MWDSLLSSRKEKSAITDHQPMEIKGFYLPDATLINILVRIAVFLHMREFTEGAAKARQHGG